MLTFDDATNIAKNHIDDVSNSFDQATLDTNGRLIVLTSKTISKQYGWIFFYATEKFAETKDRKYALIGAGPILVMKKDGELHQFGSGKTLEEWLNPFERKHKLSKLNPFH